MPEEIKQYGLRRTGTNLLAFLLTKNYDVKVHVDTLGWKHGPMRHAAMGRPELPTVIMTRHPLSWLPSMWRVYKNTYRGIWKSIPDFAHFVKWRYSGGRACPFTVRWSFAYGYWCWRNPGPIIRYEDLFVNPEIACEGLGFERVTDEFVLPDKYVAPTAGKRTPEQIAEEFAKQTFMEIWTDELISDAEKGIDPHVLEAVGYDAELRTLPVVEKKEPQWRS